MNALNRRTFTAREEGIQPLSPEERRWVQRLERILMDCPPRLELVTIGDRGLDVITNERGTEDIHDGGWKHEVSVLPACAANALSTGYLDEKRR